MSTQATVRPTPTGWMVLDAISRGRVTYLPTRQIVVMRERRGDRNVVDVSRPWVDVARAGWAHIDRYPMDLPPPEVACRLTETGQDLLMQARSARRRKANASGKPTRR